MSRLAAGACLLVALVAPPLAAQGGSPLARAEAAYRDLSYGQAIAQARRALGGRLSAAEQARAWELLGFSYAALDSARQSTDAFKQLLFLSPDRELDPARISPKITSLFALALGQVLVVRHLAADSAAFVAGDGSLPIGYTLTRTARVRARVTGAAGEALVDSSLGEGERRIRWNGLLDGGRAAPSGIYRIVVEASAGRDSYAASLPVRVVAGAVDTVAHLASLPGYDVLPETVVPPRSWRPLGVALIATAATAGAIVALESADLGGSGRRPMLTVGVGATVAGVLATIRRPAPVPAAANIRYNALVREQLARRNAEIAAENARRRQQVLLTIAPLATARLAGSER
ncbi:MAG TPA: hypothetical protein VFZ11_04005 [Gemmatimonadaceae bacterium]